MFLKCYDKLFFPNIAKFNNNNFNNRVTSYSFFNAIIKNGCHLIMKTLKSALSNKKFEITPEFYNKVGAISIFL